MNHSIAKRYVTLSQAIPLTNALLYAGEDTSLRRKVLLITADFKQASPDQGYLHRLRKVSSLVNSGFLHVLDTSFEEQSIMIVLQHKPGKPVIHELDTARWSFNRIVTLVADLGVSMLDAMEEQVSGYSVCADNLWLGDDDHLSVIQYWVDGLPQTQGALGLCTLMLQLFTGKAELPGPYEVLDTQLERVEMTNAAPKQKEALIKLVRRVCTGHASLSTLIFGLKDLPMLDSRASYPTALSTDLRRISASREAVPSRDDSDADSYNDTEEPAQGPRSNMKAIVVGSIATILLAGAFVIWLQRPSSHSDPVAATTPKMTETVQSPTPTPTKEPSPSPSASAAVKYARDGEEITMPNLVGMKLADAEKETLSSRLRYSYVMEANTDSQGKVFKQEPAAGSKVITGDSIKFWVGK